MPLKPIKTYEIQGLHPLCVLWAPFMYYLCIPILGANKLFSYISLQVEDPPAGLYFSSTRDN